MRGSCVPHLHGHMAKSAEPDDADLEPGLVQSPVLQRRPDGDAGAKQRRSTVQREGGGDAQHIPDGPKSGVNGNDGNYAQDQDNDDGEMRASHPPQWLANNHHM